MDTFQTDAPGTTIRTTTASRAGSGDRPITRPANVNAEVRKCRHTLCAQLTYTESCNSLHSNRPKPTVCAQLGGKSSTREKDCNRCTWTPFKRMHLGRPPEQHQLPVMATNAANVNASVGTSSSLQVPTVGTCLVTVILATCIFFF